MWIDAFLSFMKTEAGLVCMTGFFIAVALVVVGKALFSNRKD